MTKKELLEWLIEAGQENTSGTLITEMCLSALINGCYSDLTPQSFLDEHGHEYGYLLKASDIRFAMEKVKEGLKDA